MVHDMDGGGAELAVLRIAHGLLDRGLNVDLLLSRAEGEQLLKIRPEVRVVELGVTPTTAVAKMIGLVRYLRSARPAALIAALDVIGVAVAARHLARSRTPVIELFETDLEEQIPNTSGVMTGWVRRAAIRALYRHADGLVAVSRGTADGVARLAGVPYENVQVIYNPVVDPHMLGMAQEPVQHPWFQPDQPPVILGVGRYVKQKNFPLLVRSFAKVREVREARLVILGATDEREPEVREGLQTLASELKVEGDVQFLDFQLNPYSYMAQASVFVLSSIYEGLPTVLIEALAVGVSVVATDCPSGPREILDGGQYGELVPMDDSDALAEGILKVLSDPLPREVRQGRGMAFSFDSSVEAHLSLLRDVTGIPGLGSTKLAVV